MKRSVLIKRLFDVSSPEQHIKEIGKQGARDIPDGDAAILRW